MEISFLGGAYEVGASCILFRIKNRNILLDCGVRQGISKDPLPDFRIIQEKGGIDAIIISHAHLDHIGSLPIISKEYPNAKIYMNKMTKDLVKVLMYDSLKIMNNREAEIPLYSINDVKNMLSKVVTINYEVNTFIFKDVKLTFYNGGHIAGASCIYLQTKEGALFYSGDFSVFPQKTVEGAKIPKLRPDVAIFESTYGDRLHSNRIVEEERLINLAKECEQNKGKMLIPAFALGRAQEIILILKKAINRGILRNIKVYIDGMIKNINEVYKYNPLYLKKNIAEKVFKNAELFYSNSIKYVNSQEERRNILNRDECSIIISSSGMLTGGPSQYYAEKIAPLNKGYIIITGYQDEESPGKKVLNLLNIEREKRFLEINEKIVPVKCKVKQVGLSAHGDKEEIKALINKLKPNNLFLVHGDGKIINNLAKELMYELKANLYIPKCGESFKINLRKMRKQWNKNISFLMNKKQELNEKTIGELWKFIICNYQYKLFTIEELIYIWSGKNQINNEELRKIQSLIIDSVYFESDSRRLFLFRARNEEKVYNDLKPKELKQNELRDLISEYFHEYIYKKISFMIKEKKIILNFDFPKAVNSSIYKKMKKFEKKFFWKLEINDQINTNEAEILIRNLFKDVEIKKISYFLSQNKIVVILKHDYNIKDEIKKFNRFTGIDLKVKMPSTKIKNNLGEKDKYFKGNYKNKMEQNKALGFIEDSFSKEDIKPYKKSIKSNKDIKYIELSFLTPQLGVRYEKKIKNLANNIGWDISISNIINQNKISNIILQFCNKEGIKLKKNPSFNLLNLNVILKIQFDEDEKKLENIKEKFKYITGCNLIYEK